jgi:hypothetical protein
MKFHDVSPLSNASPQPWGLLTWPDQDLYIYRLPSQSAEPFFYDGFERDLARHDFGRIEKAVRHHLNEIRENMAVPDA